MKKQFPYPTFSPSFIYLFLIGQLWVSSVNYCYWMIDSETEFVELNTSEDSESERENEKKDKNRYNPFAYNSINNSFNLDSFCFKNFKSLHHPDVTTPPPKYFIF